MVVVVVVVVVIFLLRAILKQIKYCKLLRLITINQLDG